MERHFLLLKDQLEERGSQKTKENIIPLGKFPLVENGPYKVVYNGESQSFSRYLVVKFGI